MEARLEIREESPDDPCEHAKPFGLWYDGVRHSWHDTGEEAMQEARGLLISARARAARAEEEYVDAKDEVTTLFFALRSLGNTEVV